ncbi:MAG: DUF5110 domain-containing protein [Bacteroidales bacterium]|nr:DUF5110 domain-containing protein [Candidatus Minthousia equi]
MKKIIASIVLCVTGANVWAQQAYLVDKNVAAFYPENFQAEKHLPSPIFERELIPQGIVPANWQIKPVYSTENGKTVVTLTIGNDDDIYGTGEVVGDLRRNGKEVWFWNNDNYGYLDNDGKNLYQSHPWVLGVRKDGSAYGIIADNTWKSSLVSKGNTLKFTSEGPAFRVVVIERESSKEVMKELAKLSGTMEMPPMWAIGYQQCRYSYYPDTRVKDIVDSMRIERIPCDVVWMDIHYMDAFRVFTFDPQRFPDPKGLQDYVHNQKMKTVYMIDPGVKVEDGYFVYDQAKTNDYFIKKPDGSVFTGRVWPGDCNFPDYTRHEVRSWWSGITRDFMLKGADGLWNDMNEPAVFEGINKTMDEDAIHEGSEGYLPDSHLRYHNIYGMNMVRASKEGSLLAYPHKRPFVLSRDNFLGGQRYGATWTGDNISCWDHLQMSIPMTLNLSLSGQPFNGPDLGGFGADADAELLAHWYAIGVYFPFTRNHSCDGTVAQEPWAFGKRIEDIARTAVERRYRLLPYIYTLFREATQNGMPVMRPLFMADEKDTSLRAEQRVYMLGDDLIIIPRWAKNPALPKGDWDIVPFEEKDDLYQAYIAQRPGSIVPLANLVQSTEDYKADSLTLLVNPAADGTAIGTLYEDDKDGFGYKHGEFAEYTFRATTNEKGIITLTMEQVAGKKDYGTKHIRIGYVCDGKITYSPWSETNSISMKCSKEKQYALDASKLVFSNIDIAAQTSKEEKLHIQTEKMEKNGLKAEF